MDKLPQSVKDEFDRMVKAAKQGRLAVALATALDGKDYYVILEMDGGRGGGIIRRGLFWPDAASMSASADNPRVLRKDKP